MKSSSLFWQRLTSEWRDRLQTFTTVVDWTVLLYFVLPALIVSFFIYRSWWLEPPLWLESMPIQILGLFFFFLWGAHFKTYIRAADRIFLRKHRKLYIQLKQLGILYSCLFQCISIILLGFVVAPVWNNHFHLHIGDFFCFAVFWLSLKWLIMAIKGKSVHNRGWRSLLVGILIFAGAFLIWTLGLHLFIQRYFLWLLLLIVVNIMFSIVLLRPRFCSARNFDQDLAIEELERAKYTDMIFQLSMDIEKQPRNSGNRKQPKLFKRSKRLFKTRTQKTAYLELFIKAALRNSQCVLHYMQIISVTSLAIVILPPIWLKGVVLIAGTIFLFIWIGNTWQRIITDHPFVRKYCQTEGYFQARKIVTASLFIPFIFIIAALVVIRVLLLNQFPNL